MTLSLTLVLSFLLSPLHFFPPNRKKEIMMDPTVNKEWVKLVLLKGISKRKMRKKKKESRKKNIREIGKSYGDS